MKLILILPVICSVVSLIGGCGTPGKTPGSTPRSSPQAGALSVAVDVSEVPLADFQDEDLPLLKRHLAVSSAWKLTREGSNLVAIKRERADESSADAGKLRMTADGFYFKHQPWRRYRCRLALGVAPAPPSPEWRAIRVDGVRSRRDVVLTVQPAALPDYRSYLVLSGENNLFLEILEESMDTSRESTRRILRDANEELEKVLNYSPGDQPTPTLEGLTPAGSVRRGQASMSLERVPNAKGFQLFGYVNPGTEGATYLKLFDAGSAEIAPELVRAQTLEYVGWSSDAASKYFFNSRVELGTDSSEVSRAELWFAPNQGGPEKKLLQIIPK